MRFISSDPAENPWRAGERGPAQTGQLHSRTGMKTQTKEIGNTDVRNSLAPLPGEAEYEVITALLPLLSAFGFHYSPLSV